MKKESQRLRCIAEPGYAASLAKVPKATRHGWCVPAALVLTERGYAQVSAGGANHYAVLQELVLWASGLDCGPGEQGVAPLQ
ncbi:hypothetical protein LTR08_003796 [Meristemomyces frigidus]|nr:hypothetical protein LTR08_003796 [Meristemomyces frigidus]